MRATIAVTFLVAAWAGGAAAQGWRSVRPAESAGSVKISNPLGGVRVMGWATDSVAVEAEREPLGARVDVDVTGREARIRVVPGDPTATTEPFSLLVRVPAGSQLAVRAKGGDVTVENVTGASDLQTVAGGIRTVGPLGHVYAQTATGDITIQSWTKTLRAHSLDGDVTVADARGFVEITTVAGDVNLTGLRLWEGEVATVSGAVHFDGTFDPDASFRFETHGGAITLMLPPETSARIEVTAAEGVSRNDFAPLDQRAFAVGGGGARVEVRTFKGRVSIVRLTGR